MNMHTWEDNILGAYILKTNELERLHGHFCPITFP